MIEEGEHLSDLVEQLEAEAMGLDGGGDASGVHLLFRTVHNLKSLTAYIGQKELAATFHHLEDGLDRIRRGREPWTAAWSDQVFQSIDQTRRALGEAGSAPAQAKPPAPVRPGHAWGMPLGEDETGLVAEALLMGQGLYRLEKLFKLGLSREAFLTLPVMEDVAEEGRLLAVHPDWEAYAAGPSEQVVKILFASPKTHEELGRVFFDPLIELQPPEPVPETDHDGIRCLVIEDDAATGALLAHILGRHGSCMVAGTARAGFSQFLKAWERAEPYQVLFLDLNLPDLGGLAILSALRRFESEHRVPRNQRCMVVICTSSGDLEDIKASLVMEADGYLVKPVNPAAIEEKLALLKETWLAES